MLATLLHIPYTTKLNNYILMEVSLNLALANLGNSVIKNIKWTILLPYCTRVHVPGWRAVLGP